MKLDECPEKLTLGIELHRLVAAPLELCGCGHDIDLLARRCKKCGTDKSTIMDGEETKGVRLVYELELGKNLMEAENINAELHGLGKASPLIADIRIGAKAFEEMKPDYLERLILRAFETNLEEAALDLSRKIVKETAERAAAEAAKDSPG